MATEHTVKFVQGDDYSLEITFKDENGTPIDVSGRSFAAQIRQKATDAEPLAEFVIDDSAANVGKIVLSLTPEQTRFVTKNSVWDLEQTEGTSVRTLFFGNVIPRRDVTRVA